MQKTLKSRGWPLLIGLFVILTLSACGSAPTKKYYTLANDMTAASETSRACKLPLVIDPIVVVPPYQDDRIVFRADVFEIQFYNYRQWVSTPEKMFAGLLHQRVENSGLFSVVERRGFHSANALRLRVRLNALEELDKGDGWYARLAMKLSLKAPGGSRAGDDTAWEYDFDREQRAARQEVLGVIESLSGLYNEEIATAMSALDKFLASYEACQ